MRAVRLLLAGVAVLLGLAVAAVAVVPPLLDWGHYRSTIAVLASSAIGHPVRIDGAVTLSLLPTPVLTAAGISVQDGGGHFALTARALRLQVGLGALAEGRIDARELVLSGAVLRLPWPLGFRPDIARMPAWLTGLQARVEDSQVTIGGLTLTGIDATLVRDRLTGTLAASGVASLYNRPWRFTAHLSPPGGDGSAAVELTLDGQGAVHDSGARFSGQMGADGALAGQVSGRGADLSQLLPAPVMAWKAEGRLSLAGGLALADDLVLDLAGSPARGAVAFRVSPAPRLDLALAASRIDLDRWLPVLLRGGDAMPTGIDLSVEAATLAGGTLQHLRAAFDSTGDALSLREASATLPGNAELSLSGQVTRTSGMPAFSGALRLDAPDLPTTLRWLAPLGHVPLGGLPANALRAAAFTSQLDLRDGQATLGGLQGTLDGGPVSGSLGFRAGARPAIHAALAVDRIELDPWLVAQQPGWVPGVGGVDLDLRVAARQAVWRGTPVDDFKLEAALASDAVVLRRAEGTLDGMHVRAEGTLAASGRLNNGQLDLTSADIAGAAPLVPAGWGVPPGLMHGPAHLQVMASGKPEALNLQLGLDLADARLEAAPVLDLRTLAWSGPVTMRHPGAPRLLQALGLPDAAFWVGDGSLALRADLAGTPTGIAAQNLDLTAGVMHLTGTVGVQAGSVQAASVQSGGLQSGGVLAGDISAERLPIPLPHPHGNDPLPLLDWIASAPKLRGSLKIAAGQVLAGSDTLLRQAVATLVLGDRTLRVDGISGAMDSGRLTGAFAIDATSGSPHVHAEGQLTGLTLAAPLFGLPLDISAGTIDAAAKLDAAGHSAATLLATLQGSVTASIVSGRVDGFDLAGLRQALTARDPTSIEPAARAVLRGGQSSVASLQIACTIADGQASLTTASLQSGAGSAQATGTIDLAGRLLDLHFALHAGDSAPVIGLLMTGPIGDPRRVPELAPLTTWLATRTAQADARP